MIRAISSKSRVYSLLLLVAILVTSTSALSNPFGPFGLLKKKKKKKKKKRNQQVEQNCFGPNITTALALNYFDSRTFVNAPGGSFPLDQQLIAQTAEQAGCNFDVNKGLACDGPNYSKTCNSENGGHNVFECLVQVYVANANAAPNYDQPSVNAVIFENISPCITRLCIQQPTQARIVVNGAAVFGYPWDCDPQEQRSDYDDDETQTQRQLLPAAQPQMPAQPYLPPQQQMRPPPQAPALPFWPGGFR